MKIEIDGEVLELVGKQGRLWVAYQGDMISCYITRGGEVHLEREVILSNAQTIKSFEVTIQVQMYQPDGSMFSTERPLNFRNLLDKVIYEARGEVPVSQFDELTRENLEKLQEQCVFMHTVYLARIKDTDVIFNFPSALARELRFKLKRRGFKFVPTLQAWVKEKVSENEHLRLVHLIDQYDRPVLRPDIAELLRALAGSEK